MIDTFIALDTRSVDGFSISFGSEPLIDHPSLAALREHVSELSWAAARKKKFLSMLDLVEKLKMNVVSMNEATNKRSDMGISYVWNMPIGCAMEPRWRGPEVDFEKQSKELDAMAALSACRKEIKILEKEALAWADGIPP